MTLVCPGLAFDSQWEKKTFAAMSHPTLRSPATYPICAMVSLTHVNMARTWIWPLTFVKCWG